MKKLATKKILSTTIQSLIALGIFGAARSNGQSPVYSDRDYLGQDSNSAYLASGAPARPSFLPPPEPAAPPPQPAYPVYAVAAATPYSSPASPAPSYTPPANLRADSREETMVTQIEVPVPRP